MILLLTLPGVFENLPGLRFLWEERDLYAYKVLISKKQVSFLFLSFNFCYSINPTPGESDLTESWWGISLGIFLKAPQVIQTWSQS